MIETVEIWRITKSLVIVAVALYAGLCLIMWALQSRFVYFPKTELVCTPGDYGLSYETVHFIASDEVRLSGWFIQAKNSRGVILFCHGNGGNISHRMEAVRIFNRLRFEVLIFDYRGYGESGGNPNEGGTYLDVEAAWKHLVDERDVLPEDIVVFGKSLGGAVASYIAQTRLPSKLIVESSFTSIKDIGAEIYRYLPVKLLSRFEYNTLDYLRGVECPVLIVHSRDDDMIPFAHGRLLFEAANEPKRFLEIHGSHNEGFLTSSPDYVSGLSSFLSESGRANAQGS